MKGLARLLLFTAAALPVLGLSQTLEEYLVTRQQHGIKQSSSPAALNTFVGERVLEVSGTSKGSIGAVLILENPGDQEIYVTSDYIPEWLLTGSQRVRLIVRAVREHEHSLIKAQLISAISDQVLSQWESKEKARIQNSRTKAAPRPRPASTTSRSPIPSSSGAINAITGGFRTQSRVLSPEVQALVPVYADFIQGQNRRLSRAAASRIAQTILEFSVHFGVDSRLIVALVLTESAFNPNAVSRAGARGLGQLMPGTARMLGVGNSFSAEENLYGTTKLLRQHLDKYISRTGDSFEGLVLALAAYNAGPGAVKRHGGVPPYRETQAYVRKVVETYRRLSGQ